jgi:sarcosine oxidase
VLEEESGRPVLRTTGGLDLGAHVSEHAAALESCGADHEVIGTAEVRKRWPFLSVDEGVPVLWQPDAGIVLANEAWASFQSEAAGADADMRIEERVLAIEPSDDRVGVVTDRATYEAGAVIVTAGAWARALLAPAGIEIDTVATRETVAYFKRDPGTPIPSVVSWADPSVYALEAGVPDRIKLGEHHAGPVTDPEVDGIPDAGSVGRLERWVSEHLTTAHPRAVGAETCIYTNTPDESFVVERHGNIVVGSTCSGHGFKFAPVIGRRLAALATGAAGPT